MAQNDRMRTLNKAAHSACTLLITRYNMNHEITIHNYDFRIHNLLAERLHDRNRWVQ